MTAASETMPSSSLKEEGLVELKEQFEELQKKYRRHLPKVDPALIDDLLLRQMENPGAAPMYMVEVFLEPGIDSQKIRETVLWETGAVPAIYDNGTHVAAHHRLTLELLKSISEKEGVIEVAGEFTGGLGTYGASREHRTHEKWHAASPADRPAEHETPAREPSQKNDYRTAAYVAAGVIGAIALIGFIISGGLPPNVNAGQTVPGGAEPGVLHGVVTGPGGLPAIGATILAVQQGDDFYASSFVSVNGQYNINLPPGEYIVYVAYPDGTDETATIEMQRGASSELNFDY